MIASASLADLTAADPGAAPLTAATIEQLAAGDRTFWLRLNATFRHNPRVLDNLLRRVHFARRRMQPPEMVAGIARYLAAGYALTTDVRYYNEFLWTAGTLFPAVADELRQQYRHALAGYGGYYPFPGVPRDVVAAFVRSQPPIPAEVSGSGKRLFLLGQPFRFTRLASRARRAGFHTSVDVFVVRRRGKGVRDRLKSSRAGLRVANLAKGVVRGYRIVDRALDDPDLGRWYQQQRADVAVQRIGEILRANLLAGFPLGVLNDHQAVLPWVRGWQSLEWSVLYGFPGGATVHLIDEGLDTGPIVRTWAYSPLSNETLADFGARILSRSDERFFDALALRVHGVALQPNPADAGLQHFEIHPQIMDEIAGPIMARYTADQSVRVHGESTRRSD